LWTLSVSGLLLDSLSILSTDRFAQEKGEKKKIPTGEEKEEEEEEAEGSRRLVDQMYPTSGTEPLVGH